MYIRFTDMEKWCSDCEKWLLHNRFHKGSYSASGLATYCKDCAKLRNKIGQAKHYKKYKDKVLAKNAEWKKNNLEKFKSRPSAKPNYRRVYRLQKLYSLSTEEYKKRFEVQKGLCAIKGCGKKIQAVDHNHKTGAVRDLLCNCCNWALGSFRDSPFLCRNAADYLEKHEVK